MKLPWILLLILQCCHALNFTAIENSTVSIINDEVYKILQLCSINDKNTVGVIYMSSSPPFIPYERSLSNAIVNYHYSSDNLFAHWKSYSSNFQIIIIYDLVPHESAKFIEPWLNSMIENISWQSLKKFIIICKDSRNEILYEILSTFTVLLHRDDVIIVYNTESSEFKRVAIKTINLHSRKAPNNWISVSSVTENNEFWRYTDEDVLDTCDSVFFQKNIVVENTTWDLHVNVVVKDYPPLISFDIEKMINLSMFGVEIIKLDNNTDVFKLRTSAGIWNNLLSGSDGKPLATIFSHMNLTNISMMIIVDKNDNCSHPTGIDFKLLETKVKEPYRMIDFNSYDLNFLPLNTSFSYPMSERKIRVITKRRGIIEVPVRIREIFDIYIIISAAVISVLVVIAMRFLDGREVGRGILDTLSLILGFAIPKLPITLPNRIFFGSLILYFMILSTTFQGNVTKIISVPLKESNIDTLDELKAPEYKIYAGQNIDQNFPLLREMFPNFREHDGEHCTELVLNDPNAACIDEGEYLYSEMLKNKNFHLVKEPVRKFLTTYIMHHGWQLKDRFNTLLSRLNEAGILQKRLKETKTLSLIKAAHNRNSSDHETFVPMPLKSYKFAFITLYTGLFMASIVWIGEIFIGNNLIDIRMICYHCKLLKIYHALDSIIH